LVPVVVAVLGQVLLAEASADQVRSAALLTRTAAVVAFMDTAPPRALAVPVAVQWAATYRLMAHLVMVGILPPLSLPREVKDFLMQAMVAPAVP
jgi:hypothetical protein